MRCDAVSHSALLLAKSFSLIATQHRIKRTHLTFHVFENNERGRGWIGGNARQFGDVVCTIIGVNDEELKNDRMMNDYRRQKTERAQ